MKRLTVLGSTGSIGTQTLEIVRKNPDRFSVSVLLANSSAELLLAQAREFRPRLIGLSDEKEAQKLKGRLPKGVELVSGAGAIETAASYEGSDTVVAAIVGMAGLKGVVSAIKSRKEIVLANKEALVAAGGIVMGLARENRVGIIPCDSEHSAIWQCLEGYNNSNLARIILTASGGMFYSRSLDELKKITPEEATVHPNWSMGKKITVDSSTMMNKGLELIEARWLFDTENIDYVIHKESIIHSLVEFTDGTMLAQMSNPDMQYPISYALSYPERLDNGLPKFRFDKSLSFLPPRDDVFIAPRLCREALRIGGSAPCVLNSANEAAVDLFLNGRIGFLNISYLVSEALSRFDIIGDPTLEDLYLTHTEVTEKLMTDYNRFLTGTNS